ncbi:hypothetical protein BmHG_00179 [Borrelia miyamotoi]|nr:hypothetical protein BOM_0700 [Borrelia miyamotoi FR64b]BCR08585.1 hypothetical protein BmHH_00176 [Borrelia miyamotoi]BCR09415.1 hypothetical protein BmHG_00179 [Borrelia miyamotoi]BCR10244.1 hypothetical protein BmHF_00177 [Borrelia miyamotoi]BCR11073.1 hypothetical protein BmHI_00177 [Borrelia miyamotoi]
MDLLQSEFIRNIRKYANILKYGDLIMACIR